MVSVTFHGDQPVTTLQSHIEQSISNHRSWYMFQGIIFVLAGILAMVLPGVTALGFELLIGALLIASGLVQGVASLRSKLHWWSLASASLSVIVGGLMLFYPLAGVIALATILAIFLVVEGITELFLSFHLRPIKNWGWLFASGIISLLLAMLLFAGWPDMTAIFLGIIIGINLLLYGIALLLISYHININHPQGLP